MNRAVSTIETPALRPRFRDARIEMSHGAGGTASRRLIEDLLAPILFAEPTPLTDAAHVVIGAARVAATTDTFVVRPLTFPGGSIGVLAVNGTVNDLAVSGAHPEVILATLVLEAGLDTTILEAEVRAMARAARAAGVRIVGGDTKVVEHGHADGLYITTTGLGRPMDGVTIDARSVKPGDHVLISGPIGNHGVTILLARGDLDLDADLQSDSRPVTPFVRALVDAADHGVRWMRDPTRGGVATALNELARDAGVGIRVDERACPVHDAVRGACELLGLDPLHIANEGQVLAVVAAGGADAALERLRRTEGGHDAARIGEVVADPPGTVLGVTPYGATRVIDMLVGDPLPRIC